MFVDTVRETLTGRCGVSPGDGIVVAVSGGPDSTALLRALHDLRQPLALRLVVAHLNHGLRGRDASADRAFVRRLARRLGIPFESARAPIARLARERGVGIEAAGRDARYAFLHDVRARTGAKWIATGHTMDDQAETLFLRIARGTGPRGLAGIHTRRADGVIRPLIEVRRADARAYLHTLNQRWREDASNDDVSRDRARVRRSLMPALAEAFGPSSVEAIARLAGIMEREWTWTEEIVAARAAEVVLPSADETVTVDRRKLTALPEGLALRVLARLAEPLGAGSWSEAHRARLVERLADDAFRGALDLPGVRVHVTRAEARFERRRGRGPALGPKR